MATPQGDVIAFIDLGTHSVRLLVVRIDSGHAYTVLTQQKEAIRLGEGEFLDQQLQPAAIERAVLVCRHFAEMARSFGATDIVAVATSATREAHNQGELLRLLREEAKVDMRVISGLEEARLIYLGVVSGLHLGHQLATFIDIGGGSTEVIIGHQREYLDLDSLKLGTLRLAVQFIGNETGPISAERYAAMQQYVRDSAVRFTQRFHGRPTPLAFGSSGTIENLAALAARTLYNRLPERHETLSLADLGKVAAMLRGLTVDERRKLPGLNPERADIIVPGAAILETLMQDLGLTAIRVSDRGLREGLLQDYLARHYYSPEVREMSVRARSVLHLGSRCGFDAAHAMQVARLAGQLFDSARDAGLHTFGPWERDLLGWAAQLHDIGAFVSYSNHQRHGYYLISNADLLGFDQTELAIMATTVFFHRKVFPRPRYPEFAVLDARAQEIVRIFCVLLRLAESLDRSHAGLVDSVTLIPGRNKHLTLRLHAQQPCPLECWGVQNHADAVKKAFGRKLVVETE